jgi:hypothetical protein
MPRNRGPEEGSPGIDGRHLSDTNIFGHGTAGIPKSPKSTECPKVAIAIFGKELTQIEDD